MKKCVVMLMVVLGVIFVVGGAVLANLDGSGSGDVVFAVDGHYLMWWQLSGDTLVNKTPTGGHVPIGVQADITEIGIADVNGNGTKDIIYGLTNGNTGWREAPSFSTYNAAGKPVSLDGISDQVSLGDMTGNPSRMTLFVANSNGMATRRRVIASGNSWERIPGDYSSGPISLVGGTVVDTKVVDLNGDGYDDVITVFNHTGHTVLQWRDNNLNTVTEPWVWNADARTLDTGDVDNDGLVDVLVGEADGTITWREVDPSNGELIDIAHGISSGGTDFVAADVGYFDDDDRLDYIYTVLDANGVETTYWREGPDLSLQNWVGNTQAMQFGGSTRTTAGLELADVDGDGLDDLIIAYTNGDVRIESFNPSLGYHEDVLVNQFQNIGHNIDTLAVDPVPEPATIGLVSFGAIGFIRRKK